MILAASKPPTLAGNVATSTTPESPGNLERLLAVRLCHERSANEARDTSIPLKCPPSLCGSRVGPRYPLLDTANFVFAAGGEGSKHPGAHRSVAAALDEQ
ncbi:uncharacterized protein L3040_004189 [Drepanopeziza brunnea f. sp. 'multigermtubi']|uniref:uncharacterized protein n=1 Tax=Drepanopeziza brunnea f. sp. 'multigermtubi' TaxID=698441 RepID=UPI0023981A49|nr:hypothetical protein L3040_004189 [Drepanopeziza brunnea f. sp. 'multigermtubi']